MIAFLALVKYNVIEYFRDKKSVVTSILTVFLTALILGAALKDNFIGVNESINKFKVGLVIEDTGVYSKKFEKYIEKPEVKEVVDIYRFNTMDEAKTKLGVSEIKNIIYIPRDYSENLSKGKEVEIKVVTEREGDFYDKTVNSIIDCFNKYENMMLEKSKLNSSNEGNIKKLDIKYINWEGQTPTSMDYYGVTMLVMLIMSLSSRGCRAYARVKNTSLGERQRMAPIENWIHISASVIAQFIIGTCQWVIFVILCKTILHVNYGDNIFVFVGICSILSIFSIIFGVMIGEIVGNYSKAQTFLMLFVYGSTFLTGGFSGPGNINLGNSLIKNITNMLPSYHSHNMLFSYIYSPEKNAIFKSIWSMTIGILVLMVIGFLIARRRRYDYIKN